jgi:hypothetical protein
MPMKRLVRNFTPYLVLALTLATHGAAAIDIEWPSGNGPAPINVTGDSTPGWRPTEHQIAQLHKTMEDFFNAKDAGRAIDAYALLADQNKTQKLPEFTEQILKFNLLAGSTKDRRIVKITWTMDPDLAPAPGVYAALDVVSKFENIDRFCGVLILYQPPSGNTFQVMREESNYFDNATAKRIEQQQSRTEVDKLWKKISANCPNYQAETTPLPEQPASSIGYPTVDAALRALHLDHAVQFSAKSDWIIAFDPRSNTTWSFVPSGDPAYPSVLKRQVVNSSSGANMETNIHCEATKIACDDLVRRISQ